MSQPPSGGRPPRILVFSTNAISDMAIDLAGSSHLDYPPTVQVIALPCSSGINPTWIVHAVEVGFDGVFVAADGGECAYVPDCTARTGRLVEQAQARLTEKGSDARRVKMGALCSVCSDAFVNHMKQFGKELAAIVPAPMVA
jgi:F420-non-reducing hydrogenase iron-sulfur subunit